MSGRVTVVFVVSRVFFCAVQVGRVSVVAPTFEQVANDWDAPLATPPSIDFPTVLPRPTRGVAVALFLWRFVLRLCPKATREIRSRDLSLPEERLVPELSSRAFAIIRSTFFAGRYVLITVSRMCHGPHWSLCICRVNPSDVLQGSRQE